MVLLPSRMSRRRPSALRLTQFVASLRQTACLTESDLLKPSLPAHRNQKGSFPQSAQPAAHQHRLTVNNQTQQAEPLEPGLKAKSGNDAQRSPLPQRADMDQAMESKEVLDFEQELEDALEVLHACLF